MARSLNLAVNAKLSGQIVLDLIQCALIEILLNAAHSVEDANRIKHLTRFNLIAVVVME